MCHTVDGLRFTAYVLNLFQFGGSMSTPQNTLLLTILKHNADHAQDVYERVRAMITSGHSLVQQDNTPPDARSAGDVPDSAA